MEEKSRIWNNELDTRKHLLEIHSDEIVLSEEFKKSRLTDKEKELIYTMLPAAKLIIDLTPNKNIGREIARMDLITINAMPVLQFNDPSNHVLNRYTDQPTMQPEEKQDGLEGFWEKLNDRVSQKKNPPIEYN